MVLETKSNAPKQAPSSDSTNGAKSAMQSMSINKAAASSSASAAAAADFEDISCKERFKCTGQEIFNALTQREMIQVQVAVILCCELESARLNRWSGIRKIWVPKHQTYLYSPSFPPEMMY